MIVGFVRRGGNAKGKSKMLVLPPERGEPELEIRNLDVETSTNFQIPSEINFQRKLISEEICAKKTDFKN